MKKKTKTGPFTFGQCPLNSNPASTHPPIGLHSFSTLCPLVLHSGSTLPPLCVHSFSTQRRKKSGKRKEAQRSHSGIVAERNT